MLSLYRVTNIKDNIIRKKVLVMKKDLLKKLAKRFIEKTNNQAFIVWGYNVK